MRFGIAIVTVLLAIALGACALISRRSRRKIGTSVGMLLSALTLPVVGNLIIICSRVQALSTVGCYIYFLGMDLVMYALLRFTLEYCPLSWKSPGLEWFVYILLILDAAQLLLNPIFGHSFGVFGLLVFYFALYYRPVRLLDRMLANIASEMPQALFFFDAVGRCVWANRPGRRLVTLRDRNYEACADRLNDMFKGIDLKGDEWSSRRVIKDGGSCRYYALEKHQVADSRGRRVGSFLSVRDDTEQQIALKRETYAATHDSLTDLYTREYLYTQVRWNHPKDGLLMPGAFVPVFERNGMIADVDKYMWRSACEILARWRSEGRDDLFISINISPKDFYFMDVVQELKSIVAEYDIDPARLRAEITETVMMTDNENRIQILNALKDAGFLVEMDDFGSGYSSLNMLKDMPVDIVKIDMVFLRKAKDDAKAQTILQNIVKLTGELGLSSVTEGVETEEQYVMLSRMGCKLFQGYYFARPMPVDSFEAMCEEKARG